MEYIVTNSSELSQALKAAQGGDAILLKGDAVFSINNQSGLTPTSEVTITSFDPEQPATISTLILANASNITIDSVIFDSSSDGATRSDWMNDINVSASSNITIKNSDMVGTAEGPLTPDGEYARAETLGTIRNTDGFTFENNTVSNYNFGLRVLESTDTTISNSEFSGLQGDPLRFGGVQGVLIEGNYIHDLFGSDYSLNHMDMIQFWSSQTTLVTQDVMITGNVLDAGDGAGAQSIFIRNEKVDAVGDEFYDLYYKNITITDNVIYNGDSHGITVGQTDGLVISNNTLITNNEANVIAGDNTDKLASPAIFVGDASMNVQITNNVSANVTGPDDGVIEGNYIIDYKNPLAENYVGNVFVSAMDGGSQGLQGLSFDPSGPLGGTAIGSSLSQFNDTPEELTPLFTYDTVGGSESLYRFDGTLTAGADGFVSADSAVFEWTFADGTKAFGAVIEHDFGDTGLQDVTLRVYTEDGSMGGEISREVMVRDEVLFEISTKDGTAKDLSSYASSLTVDAEITQDGLHVSSGKTLQIDRANDHIYNLEQFSLSFGMMRDSATSGYGVVAAIHKSFSLVLNKAGELEFSLTGTDGSKYKIVSEGASIDDTDWHKVTVSYDSLGGVAEIFVDGKSVGAAEVDAATLPLEFWGLTLGSEWSGGFTGMIDDVRMTAEPTTSGDALQDTIRFLTEKEASLGDIDLTLPDFGSAVTIDDEPAGLSIAVDTYQAGVQDHGSAALNDDGTAVTLSGNAWKTVDISGQIQSDTVLRFEFTIENAGEIHAISFATDGVATPQNTFQLYGSQNYGLQNFRSVYSEVGSTVTVEIPVGKYMTGEFDKIVLIGDDDAAKAAVTTFGNFELFNSSELEVSDSDQLSDHLMSLESYGNFLQDVGSASVSDDGNSIELSGNAWKFIEKGFSIDEDSTLNFTLSGDDQGEVQAIGFLRDGKMDENNIFQLGGSQKFGIQDYNGLSGLDNGTLEFSLEVGKYLQGAYDGIVLISDDDFDASSHTVFSDLEFFA